VSSDPAAYTALDIETTGLLLRKDDVLEIGAVRFEAGRPTGDRFVQLVRPRIPIPAEASAVHGLTDDQLRDAPEIGEVMAGLLDFLQGELVVCHNAPFDVPFLARELRAHGLSARHDVADTLVLSRRLLPLQSHSLGPVCERLGVRITGRHRSEGDALATGKVFWRLMEAQGDPVAGLQALRGRSWLEPMSFDLWAHLRAVAMVEDCPPGTEISLRYATNNGTPKARRVTVEFYSCTRSAAHLTGRAHDHGGERRSYRLDRVQDWH
jgi:DNA polymerase III epsilon subunit family exonuclease